MDRDRLGTTSGRRVAIAGRRALSPPRRMTSRTRSSKFAARPRRDTISVAVVVFVSSLRLGDLLCTRDR